MKFSITRTLFLIFILCLTWHLNSSAVCLTQEVEERLRQEGRLEEWLKRWESAAQRGMYEMTPAQLARLAKRSFGDVDTVKPLVLCVDFSDNEHTYNVSKFDTLLFSRNLPGFTGSFRDYYLENSYGQHDLQGGVYGWVRAPQTYDYYTAGASGLGSPPHNAQQLVNDILAEVDPYVNFQEYDYDGNGWIDGLIVVHAGPGAEETGSDGDIWSHRWQVGAHERDNVWISSYTMQPEMHKGGSLIDIGVFCHEWGHFLGINWEEYDRDTTESEGLGYWSVMARGCYNNGGKTPAHHSAYCKYRLGWANVITVESNQTNVEILQVETSPVVYRLWMSGSVGNQFFMVENRQKTGFDSYLPGSGLLIYHVDESMLSDNDLEWCPGSPPSHHYKTALEQADGRFQLEGCHGLGQNRGDTGDPFPGSKDKRAFDDTTTPSSRDYYDNSTQVAVWNISDPGSAMYANLDVTWSRPNLVLGDFRFNDTTGGDGDGRPEPDETVRLYFSVSNIWADLSGAWVIASVDTEGITFSKDSANLGDIGSGETVDNYDDSLEFSVATGFPIRKVNFTLHICGNGEDYCTDLAKEAVIGPTEILLVDDDNHSSGDSNYVALYEEALDSLGAVYDIWDRQAKPKAVNLSEYPILIWFTGNHRDSIFSAQDVGDLMSYLDGGGTLFLTSQDAVEDLSGSADPLFQEFLTDYLHVGYDGDNTELLVFGHLGDEIDDSLWIYPGGPDSPDNQTSKDNLVPNSEANTILLYADIWWTPTGLVAGAKFQNDLFKVVVFGFGFEGINSSGSQYYGRYVTKPHVVMQRVLGWLRGSSSDAFEWEDEFASLPKSVYLNQNYPNPFNPETKIEFGLKSGTPHVRVSLKIYNVRGQLVRTLVDEEKPKGIYSVIWDGKDQKGNEVSSGIYFCQLKAGDNSEVRKMILLK